MKKKKKLQSGCRFTGNDQTSDSLPLPRPAPHGHDDDDGKQCSFPDDIVQLHVLLHLTLSCVCVCVRVGLHFWRKRGQTTMTGMKEQAISIIAAVEDSS